ncbi:MAG: pantetheine-phosphate adenylyltransferase [Patiriisocius sp.]|jgi:pantetheine-phosphate adenylyltransferase
MKTAVFPGSFDPFTKGHEDVVRRGLEIFDHIIIAIGVNTSKKHFFSLEDRIAMINDIFKDEDRISVESFSKLTVDYCKEKSAPFILRGLRDSADFNYERNISQVNQAMWPDVETIFLITTPKYAAISSTILREILRNKGDISKFIPNGMKIEKYLHNVD